MSLVLTSTAEAQLQIYWICLSLRTVELVIAMGECHVLEIGDRTVTSHAFTFERPFLLRDVFTWCCKFDGLFLTSCWRGVDRESAIFTIFEGKNGIFR